MRALLLILFAASALSPAALADAALDSTRIPDLVKNLDAADVQVRAAAAEELAEFGPEARRAVPALVRMLADDATYQPKWGFMPANLYDAAFRSLIEIGSESVADLIGALDDPAAGVRQRAAEALGRIGVKAGEALPKLLEAASDRESAVRFSAVQALPKVEPLGNRSVPLLLDRLRTDDVRSVREQIAISLAAYRNHSDTIVPALLELLKVQDPAIRGQAAESLGKIAKSPNAVIPALMALFADRTEYMNCFSCNGVGGLCLTRIVAADAVWAVGEFGVDGAVAAPALVELIAADASGGDEMHAATYSLSRMGMAVKPFVPKLVEILERQDLDPQTKTTILSIFRKLGRHAGATAPILRKLFDQTAEEGAEDADVRRAASCALLCIDFAENIEAWRSLLSELDAIVDRDEETIREYAEAAEVIFETLGEIGPKAAPAVPQMAALLGKLPDDRRVATKIVIALGQIGPEAVAAVPSLVRQLSRSVLFDDERQTMTTLLRIGRNAIPALTEGLDEFAADDDHCVSILEALAQFEEEAASAVPAILRMTNSGDGAVRTAAARALGRIRSSLEATVPELSRLLKDARPLVREQAALSLSALRTAATPALAALTTALSDECIDVRAAAAEALGNLGPKARPAVPALKKALSDPSRLVSGAAEMALRKME